MKIYIPSKGEYIDKTADFKINVELSERADILEVYFDNKCYPCKGYEDNVVFNLAMWLEGIEILNNKKRTKNEFYDNACFFDIEKKGEICLFTFIDLKTETRDVPVLYSDYLKELVHVSEKVLSHIQNFPSYYNENPDYLRRMLLTVKRNKLSPTKNKRH